jgi:hypothetical protein
MRYELTDYEWDAIKPMLPNKARDCRNSIHFLGLNVGDVACLRARRCLLPSGTQNQMDRLQAVRDQQSDRGRLS